MAAPPPLSARAGVWQQDLTTGSSDWYVPEPGGFSITVSNTWTGSVKLQRSFDSGTTAIDYTNLDQAFAPTTNFSSDFVQAEKRAMWRLTFTPGSGTVTVRFGQ